MHASPGGTGSSWHKPEPFGKGPESPRLDECLHGKELQLQCDARELLDGLAMQTDHDLRRSITMVLTNMGFKPKHLQSVKRVVLKVLDHSEDRLAREAARLYVLFADHVRPRIKQMGEAELFAAAVLLAELVSLSVDCEPIEEERLDKRAIESEGPGMKKEFARQLGHCQFERDYLPESLVDQHNKTVGEAEVLWEQHLRNDRSFLPEKFQEMRDKWNTTERLLREKIGAQEQRIKELEDELASETARYTALAEDLIYRLAVETELGNRYMSHYPWSNVTLMMPMKGLGGQIDGDSRRNICSVLASSLSLYGVAGSDCILCEEGGGIMRVVIHLRKPGSVYGAIDLLQASLDGRAQDGVVPVLSNFGQPKKAVVVPDFPLQRIRLALEMRFQTSLTRVQYENLIADLTQQSTKLEQGWAVHQEAEPDQTATLVELENHIKLDELIPEDPRVTPEMLATARRAHHRLKSRMAPGSPWAETPPESFEDLKEWRATNRLRSFKAPADHPIRAEHYDPGVGNHIFSRQGIGSPGKPRLLSRFCLIFDNAEELMNGLNHIKATYDVVWVENRFGAPSIVGERDINVGIRQTLEGDSPQTVLTELTLLLREMWALLDESLLFEAIGDWGVKKDKLLEARFLVMRLCETTEFRACGDPEVGGNFIVRHHWGESGRILERAEAGSPTYPVLREPNKDGVLETFHPQIAKPVEDEPGS